MREVARRARCTHQAPYHHFANREAILAALVCEGFEELAERLCAVHDGLEVHGLLATLKASEMPISSSRFAIPGSSA